MYRDTHGCSQPLTAAFSICCHQLGPIISASGLLGYPQGADIQPAKLAVISMNTTDNSILLHLAGKRSGGSFAAAPEQPYSSVHLFPHLKAQDLLRWDVLRVIIYFIKWRAWYRDGLTNRSREPAIFVLPLSKNPVVLTSVSIMTNGGIIEQ